MIVQRVIREAAQRYFTVVVVEQLAFALVPVLGGFILLLLLGTQILHWYWMAAVTIGGLAIATVRVRGRHQSKYETAQVLDHRLRLDDSLSTAWFLLENGVNGHDPVASFQIQQAEDVAERVRAADAFPLIWRRAWMLTGALAAVALGLFAVRYLVTRSLSLQQSIAPIQISPVFEALATRLHGNNERRPFDAAADGRAQQNTSENGTQLPEPKQADNPQPQAGPAQSLTPTNAPGDKAQAESGKPADQKSGEGQNSNSANTQDSQQSEQSAANEKNSQGSDKREANSGQQGLMDKMKDALSSLMAKMQNTAPQQQAQSNQSSDEDKAGSQSAGKAQPGQQPQQAQNRQSNQDQSAEAQSPAQASERTQASQGKSSDAMPEKGADAHSGIGRQDGDKDVKEAEQLAAMGKLAEIIGKRSANLTGDMTVETPSGKQQLKTAYSQKMGHHADTGGEINRDEIPLADQQYVREYMELVRKQSKPQQ
ncbi:MAG TPA: hypothetical protein VH302_10265 [Bryobacteraceae bacterium]|nr:hypothetical protein [Bryobacteraceae bacterium]